MLTIPSTTRNENWIEALGIKRVKIPVKKIIFKKYLFIFIKFKMNKIIFYVISLSIIIYVKLFIIYILYIHFHIFSWQPS